MVVFLRLVAAAVSTQGAPPREPPDSLRELAAASEVIACVRVEDLRLLDFGVRDPCRRDRPHARPSRALLPVESIVVGD